MAIPNLRDVGAAPPGRYLAKTSHETMLVRAVIFLTLCAIASHFETVAQGADELRLDARAPFFTLNSDELVGAANEERLDVSIEARCGSLAWVFDRAELVIRRSRFGQAQFVELPAPGCVRCRPVRVKWYHEPTGFLDFDVNVYRRRVQVRC